MSRNYVSAGRRLAMAAQARHSGGDLVFYHGFFGWVQDDVASGALGTLILDGEVTYDRPAFLLSRLNPGVKLSAMATIDATTLALYPPASVPAGGVAIGRTTATTATASGKIRLFTDNSVY